MADWTQIYQNPQTQALFGGAVPPIPSPSVQPIGGWGNVDLTQSMMNAPQQPQRPQMPVQTPQAPQTGQDGAMGIGQLIMMMLPMLLAGGTKHPNNARSAYMMGLMQQMNQQKALQQQKMAQQQAQMMEEQKRKYALANDLFKALTQNNPEAMYDGNLIGFMQTGDFEGMRNYINENRESLMPTKEPEKVDPWADKKVVGGHVASFDAEGNPVWISPPEKPKEYAPQRGIVEVINGKRVLVDPTNGNVIKELGDEVQKPLTRADKDAIWRAIMGGVDMFGSKMTGLANMYKTPEELAQAIEQYYGEGTPEYEHAMNIAFNAPESAYKGKDPRNKATEWDWDEEAGKLVPRQ